MKTERLQDIVTRLDQTVQPFIVIYFDADAGANRRLLVFGVNIVEVSNITENFLADISVDGAVISIELLGVQATLYGIKPTVQSAYPDEFDDLIRR